VLAVFPSSAAAAPALVLGRQGDVIHRNDPFLNGPELTPAPSPPHSPSRGTGAVRTATARAPGGSGGVTVGSGSGTTGAGTGTGTSHSGKSSKGTKHSKKRKRPQITVATVLLRLLHSNQLSPTAYRQYSASWSAALGAERHLKGTRLTELTAVTETVHQIAASHQLTPSRLPPLFETLDRNRQWWTTGPLLSSGQRVEFAGSQLVWEYYPGQGIQLQVLGSFGKADGLYTAGAAQYPAMEQLLSEMIPLAARRGGGMTWEYYFSFDGGSPPWTSAMSQSTGLEALTRAYKATDNPYYLQVAAQALPVFTTPPPAGVEVKTPVGIRYLQYTFAPNTSIINAFLQTLIGLHDYATVSGNPVAEQLFGAANAEALQELPSFDTGAWSLYQPGIEDDLSYHELVTGFLQQLCTLTATPLYCTTAAHFESYLKTPPALQQLTFHGRAHKTVQLRFSLSKISHVGIVVRDGSQTAKFLTSTTFPYGTDHFSIPPLRHAGAYSVTLTATDLAGNFTRITGTLSVS
jgi:D-glucuronyl C5-epimerase C-terminus